MLWEPLHKDSLVPITVQVSLMFQCQQQMLGWVGVKGGANSSCSSVAIKSGNYECIRRLRRQIVSRVLGDCGWITFVWCFIPYKVDLPLSPYLNPRTALWGGVSTTRSPSPFFRREEWRSVAWRVDMRSSPLHATHLISGNLSRSVLLHSLFPTHLPLLLYWLFYPWPQTHTSLPS